MKFVCSADWHISNFKDYATPAVNGINSRAQWILYAITQMLQWAYEHKIRYVLFAGDLFHQRGKVEVALYNAIYDILEDYYYNYGVTVIMVPGNHDNIDNSDKPEFSFRKFSEIAWVVPDFKMIELEDNNRVGANLFCVPFVRNVNKTKEKLKEFADIAVRVSNPILLAHIGVTGGITGKEHYILKDTYGLSNLMAKNYKYVVLGHYHTPQILAGTTNAFYCGMPIQRDFNDEGSSRGFFVIDTDKRCDIKFVEIPLTPKFISVKFDMNTKYDWTNMTTDFYKFFYKNQKELDTIVSNMPEGSLYKTVMQKEFKKEQRVNNISVDMNFSSIVANWADEFQPSAKELGIEILNEVLSER